jgi:hypothetical protein
MDIITCYQGSPGPFGQRQVEVVVQVHATPMPRGGLTVDSAVILSRCISFIGIAIALVIAISIERRSRR